MQMDIQYQPEAVTSKDEDRPALFAVNIGHLPEPGVEDGIDVAMASNGFMAVAVPVTLEEGDVPGMVSAAAFQAARKLGKTTKLVEMTLLKDTVRLTNGVEYPRPEGTYPDLARVLPDTSPLAERPDQPMFTLNPTYLASIGKALGTAETVIERFAAAQPLVIYPSPIRSERMILSVPFAVLMGIGSRKRPVNDQVTSDTILAVTGAAQVVAAA